MSDRAANSLQHRARAARSRCGGSRGEPIRENRKFPQHPLKRYPVRWNNLFPQNRDAHDVRGDGRYIRFHPARDVNLDEPAPWRNSKMPADAESPRAAGRQFERRQLAQTRLQPVGGYKNFRRNPPVGGLRAYPPLLGPVARDGASVANFHPGLARSTCQRLGQDESPHAKSARLRENALYGTAALLDQPDSVEARTTLAIDKPASADLIERPHRRRHQAFSAGLVNRQGPPLADCHPQSAHP